MYTKNNNEQIVLFDVDDTLISFQPVEGQAGVEPIEIVNDGHKSYIYPITKVIEKLKEHKARNHYVRVHSKGGKEWAETVIKALHLENFVDNIETKPCWYYDDLPADEWMFRVNYGVKH